MQSKGIINLNVSYLERVTTGHALLDPQCKNDRDLDKLTSTMYNSYLKTMI